MHSRPAPLSSFPKIRALMSMPCADFGVGQTCRSLLRGALACGLDADLFTSRSDSSFREPFRLHSFTPWPLGWLPHRLTRQFSVRRLHASYLGDLEAGQIAYLWPSTPPGVFEIVKEMGLPIVCEAINTRMADAKPILDAAYEELGLPPTHKITDARIAQEESILAMADYIFSPSPATDQSLARSRSGVKVLQASYGTAVPKLLHARPPKASGAPVTFLFIGLSCIRKGLQHLLEVWRDVPANARLRIIGFDQPELARLYRDVLNQPNVSVSGFSTETDAEFAGADVFVLPSLEEGDPLVVYEAAARGLPVIASLVGSGRIGAETGAINTIDTADIAALRHEITRFAQSSELRHHWGQRARAAALHYDWEAVSERRFNSLALAMAPWAPPRRK